MQQNSILFLNRKQSRTILLMVIISILLIIAYFFAVPNGSMTIGADDQRIAIAYGDHQAKQFTYDEIASISFHETFEIGNAVVEEVIGSVRTGIYQNQSLGNYAIYAYMNVESCIVLNLNNSEKIVFNLENDRKTKAFYEEILKKSNINAG